MIKSEYEVVFGGRKMRTNPHIIEINARAWFRKIQRENPDVVTLGDVPESYLLEVKEWGFDALWLMGVWKESAAAREIARADAGVNEGIRKVVPDYSSEDIMGSPFAVLDYAVDEMFGGNEALLKFKERLNGLGVALILDFVGNHLAVDHPLTLSDPDIFVHSKIEPDDKDTFFLTENGDWLAHGKDPHTPAWTDTVQLNLFDPRARDLVISQILDVAKLCDGVRCDVVMVMLNKIFKETWGGYVGEASAEELWAEVIGRAHEKNPEFMFIAEVYWGLEWEVQELGFDYTYDKVIYDRLLMSTPSDVRGHLGAEHIYQARSVRFVANHDEDSPIAVFGLERSKAAAVAALTGVGARMFTLDQLYGSKYRLPVQYVSDSDDVDYAVFDFYKKLLAAIDQPCFHDGEWELVEAGRAEGDDDGFENVFAWSWTLGDTRKIVVVNYSDGFIRCAVAVDGALEMMREEFAQSDAGVQIEEGGFELGMGPYEVMVLSVG